MGVKRKLIGIVGALVLALVGTFVVLNNKGKDEGAVVRAQVPMLVAAQKLDAGTAVDKLIADGLAVVQLVDVEQKSPDALGSLDDLGNYKGRVLGIDVSAGGALLTTSFVDRSSLGLTAGGIEVPADMLQVSFSLEPQRVLGGALRPGDRIAVVGSFSVANPAVPDAGTSDVTHIIVQKALVANVQMANLANANDSTSVDGAPAVVGNYMVTLALSAPDTERLTHALEYGRLWLAKQPDAADGSTTKVWDVNQTLNDPVTSYAAAAAQ